MVSFSLVSMEISYSQSGQYLPKEKLPFSCGKIRQGLSQAAPCRVDKRNHGSSPVPTGELPCCHVSLTSDTKLLAVCFYPSYTCLFSTYNLNQCIPGSFLSSENLTQSHLFLIDFIWAHSTIAYSGLSTCLTLKMGLEDFYFWRNRITSLVPMPSVEMRKIKSPSIP